MAGSRPCLPLSADVAFSSPLAARGLARKLKLALWRWPRRFRWKPKLEFRSGSETPRAGMGASSMSEAQTGSLLVEYFKEFVKKRDVDEFRERVSARYNEGTLGRILTGSPDVSARRAAVLSLGMLGTFEQSNAVLGKALRDQDLAVRSMAEDALWAIWFRADTPEHNQRLEQVRHLIGREQLEQAETLVKRLIADAPNFAEAYNQRAFILFLLGRFAESAEDCQRVLARNPVSHWRHRGIGKVPAQFEPSSRRPQVIATGLQAQTAQCGARRQHSRARNADRVRRWPRDATNAAR